MSGEPAAAWPGVEWSTASEALAGIAPRLADLVRGIRRPEAPALGQWSVVEVAAHLGHAYRVLTPLARGEAASPLSDLWDLGTMTVEGVEGDPERDPEALAERIETGVAGFLAAGAERPDQEWPWLVEGVHTGRTTFACHLLGEALVHGHDIARAEGRPWPIDRRAAAAVALGFIVPVFRALDGRTFVDQEAAAGVRARIELRLRGDGAAVFVLDDGSLTIEAPSEQRVDCVVSADPAAFLLVAWARTSQWNAIARGQMMAWGRRPWLGLRFRGMIRNP